VQRRMGRQWLWLAKHRDRVWHSMQKQAKASPATPSPAVLLRKRAPPSGQSSTSASIASIARRSSSQGRTSLQPILHQRLYRAARWRIGWGWGFVFSREERTNEPLRNTYYSAVAEYVILVQYRYVATVHQFIMFSLNM
jgi:hypothetical protein